MLAQQTFTTTIFVFCCLSLTEGGPWGFRGQPRTARRNNQIDTNYATSATPTPVTGATTGATTISCEDPDFVKNYIDALLAGDFSSPNKDVEKMNTKAMCSWEVVRDTNVNRIPQELNSVNCTGSVSGECGSRCTCKKVFKNVMVLYRTGCINGTYSYRVGNEPVATACVCVLTSESV